MIGRFHDLFSGLDNFYSLLLSRFVAKELGIVSMMMTALQDLKDIQRTDISRKLFKSWGNFVSEFSSHLENNINIAVHGVASAVSSSMDLAMIFARSKSEQVFPLVNAQLEVIHSSIRLAENAVDQAFSSLETTTEYLPDNMDENRYLKLDKCFENKLGVHFLSDMIIQVIENITDSSSLNYTSCPGNGIPFEVSSVETLLTMSNDIPIECVVGHALPQYVVALENLKSCLSSYGGVISDIDTWISQMETDLSSDASINVGIFSDEVKYRQLKRDTLEQTSSFMQAFSIYNATVFDVWNGLCGQNMNQILRSTKDAYVDVSRDIVNELKLHVQKTRSTLIKYYQEGLTKLSQFTYYFENRETKESLESNARSLEVWRKPSYSSETNRVRNIL